MLTFGHGRILEWYQKESDKRHDKEMKKHSRKRSTQIRVSPLTPPPPTATSTSR